MLGIQMLGTSMAPGTHLLFSWLVGVNIFKARRERALIAIAGVAPDLDGLGLIADKVSGTTSYFFQYHHYLGHSVFSAIIIASIAAVFARAQKLTVWCAAFFVVHLHLLCDIACSKGPDGYQWPIYYLYPLNPSYSITWAHQWELNAWQNILIMVLLLFGSFYYASTKRITFLEVFSYRLNEEAFKMYYKYFCKKKA
ncbi:metal-dependent hydrolase [Cellvibrio sp. NN19]|uniref:metal-dependent hydrolase n=1 Tax=Cellvibrio chitinivorans TaxID=3102792 RepID=UPI002B4102E6|nr:metal-dependent hydrolase [Cellvibrio sp. NN19]